MICEVCHKEKATIFLTETVNGKKVELHMCSICAAKEKSRMYAEDSFQQFLSGLLKLSESEAKKTDQPLNQCPECKMTLDDFRRHSKVGCANCYEVFRPYVKHVVRSVQGGMKHTGKKPIRQNEKVIRRETFAQLESDLKLAVMQEDYEEAARIRDQLLSIKEDGNE